MFFWSKIERTMSEFVFDLHAHPAIKAAWFSKDLTQRHLLRQGSGILSSDPLGFDPFVVRCSFPKLKNESGCGPSLLLSTVYALEHRALYEDLRIKTPIGSIPIIALLKAARIMPSFRKAYSNFVQPDYFSATINTINTIEREAEKDPNVLFAYCNEELSVSPTDDPRTTNQRNNIVLLHALEGAQSLEGRKTLSIQNETGTRDGNPNQRRPRTQSDEQIIEEEMLTNLEALFRRGVAVIGLSHFYPNEVTKSCFSFPERTLEMVPHKSWKTIVEGQGEGLTAIGQKVVRKMLELGIIIDLSHVSPVGRMEVYQISSEYEGEGQVIASHIGVQALHNHPYNLADWEIRWLADHGGVAGIILSSYWLSGQSGAKLGLGYVEKTVDHMVKVGGDTVVAFGSDFDGFSDPPDDVADALEWGHVSDYLSMQRILTSTGLSTKYTSSQIEGFLGKNSLRTIKAGWGKKGR